MLLSVFSPLEMISLKIRETFTVLAPVVRRVDSTMHWINRYPLDNSIDFASVYPLDSDLSAG